MLYESNRLNYFQHKYRYLAIGLLLFAYLVYSFFMLQPVELTVSFFVVDVLAFISLISCIYYFKKSRSKWKIVALNRMRVVVGEGKWEKEYTWLDVKSISLNRFLGVYKLKLKNGEEIFFTAYGRTYLLTGDSSEMGVIIDKMKRDLSL